MDIINKLALERAKRLQVTLDEWYINNVLWKTWIEVDCMSREEIDKLNDGITIKISRDKHWNDIYSAFRGWKTISQILIKN